MLLRIEQNKKYLDVSISTGFQPYIIERLESYFCPVPIKDWRRRQATHH
jgi:hypothetical protein